MKPALLVCVLLAAALFILIAGCTQQVPGPGPATTTAPPAQTTAAPSYTVMTGSTSLGTVLTDGRGMTLYYFAADIPASGTSACYAAANCSRFWPPFSAGTITVAPPLSASDFSSFDRTDGVKQTAYNGRPLYYFANDKKPGDTSGDGLQNAWYVARDYTVMVARRPNIGMFLTDQEGKPLYYYANDAPDAGTTCTGTCLEKWLPFNAGQIVVPSGLNPADFATAARTDGVKQTQYKGRLLYYYYGDTRPGLELGNGFADVWYVANTTGFAPKVPAATTKPTTVPTTIDYGSNSDSSGGGGGGGGY